MAHLKRFVQVSKNSRTTMYAKIFFAFQITSSKPFSVFLARECDGSSEAICTSLKIKEHKNGKI